MTQVEGRSRVLGDMGLEEMLGEKTRHGAFAILAKKQQNVVPARVCLA